MLKFKLTLKSTDNGGGNGNMHKDVKRTNYAKKLNAELKIAFIFFKYLFTRICKPFINYVRSWNYKL